jgi:serine protease Do
MRKWAGVAAGLMACALAMSARAETPPVPAALPTPVSPVTVTPLAPGAEVRPFGFTHLFIKLEPGKVWQTTRGGIFCLGGPKATWKTGQQEFRNSVFTDIFRTEVTNAGFKMDGDPSNLFEQTAASMSDLRVAALITDADLDYCLPNVGLGNSDTLKGARAMLKVQWQVYSSLQKTVLAKVETQATVEVKGAGKGGFEGLMNAALRENARAFIASPEFRKAFMGSAAPVGGVIKPAAAGPVIHLAGARKAKAVALSNAVSSVVMISAGASHGSGFLVSADGIILTDRHVVGDAPYVKIRWSDGIEGLGEVMRTDKVRDVALIKTDPRGRQPLLLRRDSLQPGDTVFAIGTPLSEKFQSTMTRGIVSAYRTFEGLSYIQSDVTVSPGSSGGPLLDEKGAVVAMTESGYRAAGMTTNLNLFTPVGDALDFLAASPD